MELNKCKVDQFLNRNKEYIESNGISIYHFSIRERKMTEIITYEEYCSLFDSSIRKDMSKFSSRFFNYIANGELNEDYKDFILVFQAMDISEVNSIKPAFIHELKSIYEDTCVFTSHLKISNDNTVHKWHTQNSNYIYIEKHAIDGSYKTLPVSVEGKCFWSDNNLPLIAIHSPSIFEILSSALLSRIINAEDKYRYNVACKLYKLLSCDYLTTHAKDSITLLDRIANDNIKEYDNRLADLKEEIASAKARVLRLTNEYMDKVKVRDSRVRMCCNFDVDRLKSELSMIRASEGVESVGLYTTGESQPVIIVDFKNIYIPHPYYPEDLKFNIGRMRVSFNLSTLRVKILNRDREVCGFWSRSQHPHVDDRGDACFGSIEDIIPELIQESRLSDMFMLIYEFLISVDISDSAGRKIDAWPICDTDGNKVKTSSYEHLDIQVCRSCESTIEELDQIKMCNECANVICFDCSYFNDDDGEYYCESCYDNRTTCEVCDCRTSEHDRYTCSDCGKVICSDCSYVSDSGEIYCESCYDDKYVRCSICGDELIKGAEESCSYCGCDICEDCRSLTEDGKIYCSDHVMQCTFTCDNCSELFSSNAHSHESLCTNCEEELEDVKNREEEENEEY